MCIRDRDIALYLPSYISELPELGQLYGGKGEMDLEALLAADPDVVIDCLLYTSRCV